MKSFLIIDDNFASLNSYESLIRERYSYTSVIKANNGEKALELINGVDCSVILCDIRMPVMNGIEFHKKLKKVFPLLADKVVFMSGKPSHTQLSYIENEGIPLLPKQFEPENFYNLIDCILYLETNDLKKKVGGVDKRKHEAIVSLREYKRVPVCIELECHIKNRNRASGSVINMSVGGMLVKSLKTFPLNTDIAFTVFINGYSNGINAMGKVVWSDKQLNGIQFSYTSMEIKNLITEVA